MRKLRAFAIYIVDLRITHHFVLSTRLPFMQCETLLDLRMMVRLSRIVGTSLATQGFDIYVRWRASRGEL